MKTFLRDYWLWILLPFILVIGGILVLYALGGGDGASGFVYNPF